MIQKMMIKNFKGIRNAEIPFNNGKTIFVGNNGVGKTTVIEALSLVLGYGLSKLVVKPSLFNIESIVDFKKNKSCPEIIIEIYYEDDNEEYAGTNNLTRIYSSGIRLRIAFDDAYAGLFEKEKFDCDQIPCEYYKVERYWFSDKPVKQFLIPFDVKIIDSMSRYFNASSARYVYDLIENYLEESEMRTIRSALRIASQQFEKEAESVNNVLQSDEQVLSKRLSLSLDLIGKDALQKIISPLLEGIPVDQIGAGDLCMLKTLLSIERKGGNRKKKVLIIEEPETHLSHVKMHELLKRIDCISIEEKTQIILTTHNSFIANKLNLSNVVFFGKY